MIKSGKECRDSIRDGRELYINGGTMTAPNQTAF
jgi:hypothetical protein